MGMDETRYVRRHGKLTERVSIPVDEPTKDRVDAISATNFRFSEWLRDLLIANLESAERAAGLNRQEAS
jgi:hypothetical protein